MSDASRHVGLSAAQLAAVFPFHVVFRRDLSIVQVGSTLAKKFTVVGSLSEAFALERPPVPMTFDALARPNRLLVLRHEASGMRLRGSVLPLDEDNFLLIANPWVTELSQISGLGLRLSDFAHHDAMGDMLFVLQARDTALQEVRSLAERLKDRGEALARNNAEMLRVARLKDQFLASMSHELRTPLNAILGLSEALGEGALGAVSDEQKSALKIIEESGQHLLSVINDVLDVARIEAEEVELELARFPILSLVDSAVRMVRPAAQKKRLKLTVTLDTEREDVVVDERRFKQILVNLLSNAVKFTDPGGRIGVMVDDDGGDVVFEVFDTGIGIAPEHHADLFQPFVQIDGGLERHYGGSGLGLAIVRQLVVLHGGSVSVESTPGVGSRFKVRIPTGEPSAEEVASVSQRAPVAASGRHLLVVEDNPANRFMMQSYLESRGYRVSMATDGPSGIAAVSEVEPDVVLMDIQMPGMDGLEAIRRIRTGSDVPIVALTALAMPRDRERCLEAGASRYLSKPIKWNDLLSVIEELQ